MKKVKKINYTSRLQNLVKKKKVPIVITKLGTTKYIDSKSASNSIE